MSGEAKCSIHLNVGGALYGCVLPGGHAGPHDFRTAARHAPEARDPEVLVAALRAIVDMEPEPFDFPADWDQQVAACEECKRWKDHPIQQGICDTHRQPLWDRDAHVKSEQRRLHYRMRSVAREALDAYVFAAAQAEATEEDSPKWATRRIAELAERDFERVNTPAAEATEPSAPEGATWGDVRSGLRAELIAEGMPITEATRIARKVVHRFSAAEREQEECVWRAMPTGGWHSTCGRNVLLLPVDSLCTCGRSICPDTSEEGAGE